MSFLTPAITLDELLTLNDEIRALARAGVPLERGLSIIGGDLPGRLGRLATLISQRMQSGESLDSIVEDPSLSLPPVYCAIVAAGIRAGRLPAALESLSRSVHRAAELRRTVVIAFIYPLVLLVLATIVFIFTWDKLFPELSGSIDTILERDPPVWLQWLSWTAERGLTSIMIVWVVILTLFGFWFIRSRRAARLAKTWQKWPTLGTVSYAGRVATFAETLCLLIEHQIPLSEALGLAGAASGDKRIVKAVTSLRERVDSGQRTGSSPPGLPPLLSWLILTNASPIQLVRTLRQTAQMQREYALRTGTFLGLYLPILFSAMVGGVIAFYYAILVMTSFIYLLYEMGQP